ncbi:MAG: flagellar basal body P-ring formation protein FlgA [Asticcacaulis sp.]|nr:flagellar basal body P-ring formation protein FlgA [Asticcacaulis sp.]
MMLRKTFYLLALVALLSTPAFGQNAGVTLRSQVTDGDGRITLGDLFDGAGPASNVQVGTRSGATAVLDAGIVQQIAAKNGVYWNNPSGLRRIIVAGGPDGDPVETAAVMSMSGAHNMEVLVFTRPMNTGDIVQAEDLQYAEVAATSAALPSDPSAVIGKTVRCPLRQGGVVRMSDLTSPIVAKRGETLSVTWSSGALSLTVAAIAQKDAAVGDLIQVQNPTSKKLVDVVVTGPGQAITGPNAARYRSNTQLSMR